MFCQKCGAKLREDAKFCAVCGTKVEMSSQNTASRKNPKRQIPNSASIPEKKKKTVRRIVIAGIIVLVMIAALCFGLKEKKKREYGNFLSDGEKYMVELDYKNAEDAYLAAIAIDPEQEEPYLKLADVYIVQGQYDEANSTLQQGKENVVGETAKETIQEMLRELDQYVEYEWIVEPSVEADDIFYLRVSDVECSDNEANRQLMSPYAIVQRKGEYGLIDLNGEFLAPLGEYSEVANYYDSYLMTRVTPKYESAFNKEWELYYVDEMGNINPAQGLGGGGATIAYYYCDGLHHILEDQSWFYNYDYGYNAGGEPKTAIPVKLSDTIMDSDIESPWEWWLSLDGDYAVYFNGTLVTDTVLQDCGSVSENLLAAKKDGKWGYLNSEGEIVIPFEYDASWEHYTENINEGISTKNANEEYCYAVSEGYVPLCKSGKWELRDVENNCIIPEGVFEKICPVYNGMCWVKKNGKWGVIQFKSKDKKTDESSYELMSEEEFGQSASENKVLYYMPGDYGGEELTEAFGITGEESSEQNISNQVNIYYISPDNQISLVKAGTYGFLNGVYEAGQQQFLVWETSAGGSGSLSYLFGVRNGQVYEPQISGQFMDFHEEEGGYVGYTSDFSKGYHDYIESFFTYDEKTGEFVESDIGFF